MATAKEKRLSFAVTFVVFIKDLKNFQLNEYSLPSFSQLPSPTSLYQKKKTILTTQATNFIQLNFAVDKNKKKNCYRLTLVKDGKTDERENLLNSKNSINSMQFGKSVN